ncbi:MAG: DUF2993 domain-containing protein [Cyanobacteria bacterium P01_D01_bin.6]
MTKSVEKESQKGRIIGRVLPGAVRLWLQTQVEQVDLLTVDLLGRDRQLISGYISGVTLSAEKVVYKGLALSQVQLAAEDIRINLGQVIRGKPLRLMKRFPVKGQVLLSNADVMASMASPLLVKGLTDFWRSLVQLPDFARAVEERYGVRSLQPDVQLHRPLIKLGAGYLVLSFYPQNRGQVDEQPIILGTELVVVSDHFLALTSPCWSDDVAIADISQGKPIKALSDFRLDLGSDTQITQLDLQPTQLVCTGQIMVNP